MRQGTIFTCERCGARGLAGGHCIECGGRTLDENGFEELGRVETQRGRSSGLLLLVVLVALVALVATVRDGPRFYFWLSLRTLVAGLGLVFLLPDLIRASRARRRPMRVVPIAELDPHAVGRTRIRGRVRLLEGVVAPDGTRLAAREERSVLGGVTARKRELSSLAARFLYLRTFGAYGDPRFPSELEDRVRVDRQGGRYLVDDGTGVALVDEDAFALRERPSWLARLARWLVPPSRSVVELRDGDVVEVEGLATVRHGAREVDFGLLADAAYRELGPSVLVFEGLPWEAVEVVRVERASRPRAAPARARTSIVRP